MFEFFVVSWLLIYFLFDKIFFISLLVISFFSNGWKENGKVSCKLVRLDRNLLSFFLLVVRLYRVFLERWLTLGCLK